MAFIPLPPPPIGEPQDSHLWIDWYNKLASGPLSVISNDLGDIEAGSIRGVNVNAASHTTVGSYITSATLLGDTTVFVRNTSDFSSSGGIALVIDTLNDGVGFTYTGKTSNSLTGCVGVVAHTENATIIPNQVKVMIIDALTNEMRFYGDNGFGFIDQMASIGTSNPANFVAQFGTAQSNRQAVYGVSFSNYGLFGESIGATGVGGHGQIGVIGISNQLDVNAIGVEGTSERGTGLYGSSTLGNGARINGNATKGHLYMPSLGAKPTSVTADQLAMINGKLCYTDGTNWRRVSDDVIV